MSQKTIQALLCVLTCAVIVSSFLTMMAISRWLIVAAVADQTENSVLSLVFFQLRNIPSLSALLTRSLQVVI
jgi:hypothetical protein